MEARSQLRHRPTKPRKVTATLFSPVSARPVNAIPHVLSLSARGVSFNLDDAFGPASHSRGFLQLSRTATVARACWQYGSAGCHECAGRDGAAEQDRTGNKGSGRGRWQVANREVEGRFCKQISGDGKCGLHSAEHLERSSRTDCRCAQQSAEPRGKLQALSEFECSP